MPTAASISRALLRLAALVLVMSLTGCESQESISRRVGRFFLPSRTLVVYFPGTSLGVSSQLVRSWGNDSLVVTLKEGDRWEPGFVRRNFAFTVLPCGDADSVKIRFDQRGVVMVPEHGPWFPESPLYARSPEVKFGTGPLCFVAGGHMDAEPRIALRMRGRGESPIAWRAKADHKIVGRLVWGPSGGAVPSTLWSRTGAEVRSGIVLAAWTKQWAAADSNGYFELDSLPPGPVRLIARVRGVAGGAATAPVPGGVVTIRVLRDRLVPPDADVMGAWSRWSGVGDVASGRSGGSIAGHYRGTMISIGNERYPELQDLAFECEVRQTPTRDDTAHVVFFRPDTTPPIRWFEMPLGPEGTAGDWAGLTHDVGPNLKWVLRLIADDMGRKRIEGRVYPAYGGESIGRVDMRQ